MPLLLCDRNPVNLRGQAPALATVIGATRINGQAVRRGLLRFRGRSESAGTERNSGGSVNGGSTPIPSGPLQRQPANVRSLRANDPKAPRLNLDGARCAARATALRRQERKLALYRSLSVLLPVHNAQGTLEAVVTEMLDVLPDLTWQFNVLVIDDGSTDDTSEAAGELARSYPQVRVMRQHHRQGPAAAIKCGLPRGDGEIVLIRDEACDLALHELRKLWRLMNQFAGVLGRGEWAEAPRASTHRGTNWGRVRFGQHAGGTAAPAVQMLHRQVAERIYATSSGCDDLRAELTRQGYRWCEVELRRAESVAHGASKSFGQAEGSTARADEPAGTNTLKRPRYLDRLRSFARGE